MHSTPNILFIRFSSIGDIVLCSPLLRALKAQCPQARIFFVTKKQYQGLLEHNPHIDKLFLLDGNMLPLIRSLKAERIDFIADLHNNLRSRRLRWALSAPSAVLRKYNWQKFLLVHCKIDKMPKSHVVDRYFAALQPLGITNDGKGLDFYHGLAKAHCSMLRQRVPWSSYAVIVLGGTYYTKRIPLEQLQEVVRAIPYGGAVLIGGAQDAEAAEQLCRLMPKAPLLNMCGRLNVAESAELIRQSDIVITGDTGMMHIATAYHKPIVVLWGNTVPAFGFAPYMPLYPQRVLTLQNNDLSCRPCSKLGHKYCPKKHFLCMRSLELDAMQGFLRRL